MCPCSTFGAVSGRKVFLAMTIAGSSCTAHSILGKRDTIIHPSFKYFLLFVAEQLELLPDIVVHECTELFPWELVYYFLHDHYSFTIYERLSPHQLGAPVSRPRQWLVLHKRGVVASIGSPAEFGWLFSRKVALSGHDFFAASQGDLLSAASVLARRRGQTVLGASQVDWESLLTPAQCLRLQAARDRARERGLHTKFIVDLESNLSEPKEHLPCLVTHGLVWSEHRRRPAIGAEHLLICSLRASASSLLWAILPRGRGSPTGLRTPT